VETTCHIPPNSASLTSTTHNFHVNIEYKLASQDLKLNVYLTIYLSQTVGHESVQYNNSQVSQATHPRRPKFWPNNTDWCTKTCEELRDTRHKKVYPVDSLMSKRNRMSSTTTKYTNGQTTTSHAKAMRSHLH
jgi:hypothetical protein